MYQPDTKDWSSPMGKIIRFKFPCRKRWFEEWIWQKLEGMVTLHENCK